MTIKRYVEIISISSATLTLIQIVGSPKDDHVVSGFANLLQEAFSLIQKLQLDIEAR
jgi:hypothetical protein